MTCSCPALADHSPCIWCIKGRLSSVPYFSGGGGVYFKAMRCVSPSPHFAEEVTVSCLRNQRYMREGASHTKYPMYTWHYNLFWVIGLFLDRTQFTHNNMTGPTGRSSKAASSR